VQLILTALESPTNAGGTGEGRQRDTTKAKAVSKTTVFTHLDATCGFAMAMPGDVPSSLGLRKIANYWALLGIATSGWVLSSHTNSCQLGSSSDAEVLKVHTLKADTRPWSFFWQPSLLTLAVQDSSCGMGHPLLSLSSGTSEQALDVMLWKTASSASRLFLRQFFRRKGLITTTGEMIDMMDIGKSGWITMITCDERGRISDSFGIGFGSNQPATSHAW